MIVLFGVLSTLAAYFSAKSNIYLFYGKALATEDHLKLQPTGFQDALTDSFIAKIALLVYASLLLTVIAVFYFFSAWIGFGTIIVFFIEISIVERVLPPPNNSKWVIEIHQNLTRKEANYKRDGDELRYQAAKDLREKLERKFESIVFD